MVGKIWIYKLGLKSTLFEFLIILVILVSDYFRFEISGSLLFWKEYRAITLNVAPMHSLF